MAEGRVIDFLFGTDLNERYNKRNAMKAMEQLEKERQGAQQIDEAMGRTKLWAESLTPEQRQKVSPESMVLPTKFEGLGDLGNFSFQDRARELGLTGKYSQVPEVKSYLEEPNKSKLAEQTLTSNQLGINKESLNQKRYDEAGTAISDFNSQLDLMDAFKERTPQNEREAAMKTLSPYGDDPRVKEINDSYLQSDRSGGRSYAAQLLKMASPEDFQNANDLVDKMQQSGQYDDLTITSMRNYANSNPKLFMEDISKKRTGTGEMLRGKKEAIPINTENAASVKTAQNLAAEKLTPKETTDFESTRSQYANLSNAADMFNQNFVTPYIGKAIKMAYLKANDPKFAEFITPLTLALNEYRRQNFGTAQTQSEIQNFLDVLNTELNVSPKVFQKQLTSVMSAIERDYANAITTREQQNKVVPNNLKSVKQDKFVTGKIYTDANGNKARYNNGEWEEVK